MVAAIDITNRRFGMLVAKRKSGSKGGRIQWTCKCDCGKTTVKFAFKLTSGNVKSCGCSSAAFNTKHGGVGTPEYRAWTSMRARCLNPTDSRYPKYGGRGIKICRRWLASFDNFLEDLGKRPNPKMSVDRENNDGNYTPKNCRWATKRQQSDNRSVTIRLTFKGKTRTLKEWATITGINYSTLATRHKRGWTVKEILS